jgi:hypothetical protein
MRKQPRRLAARLSPLASWIAATRMVDRSRIEQGPGVYATIARIGHSVSNTGSPALLRLMPLSGKISQRSSRKG